MNDDELLPFNNSATPRRSTNNSTNNEILKAYQVNAFKYVNKNLSLPTLNGIIIVLCVLFENFHDYLTPFNEHYWGHLTFDRGYINYDCRLIKITFQ